MIGSATLKTLDRITLSVDCTFHKEMSLVVSVRQAYDGNRGFSLFGLNRSQDLTGMFEIFSLMGINEITPFLIPRHMGP